MKIRIPIPKRVLAIYDRFENWGNTTIGTLGRHEVVWIDVLLTILFVITVGWYYYTGGWMAALAGGLMFAFLTICALWIWRR